MANHTTGAQRHNKRQDKIWATYKKLDAGNKHSVLELEMGDTFTLVSDIKWRVTSNPKEEGGFYHLSAIDELGVKRNFKFGVEARINSITQN